MDVTLIVNTDAGAGGHDPEEIAAAFRAAGHSVRSFSKGEDGWKRALRNARGLVVAAGGDGMVEKVARRLAGQDAPLAVLALGTANNIAGALGHPGSAQALAGRVEACRRRSVDMGLARGPWGSARFVEAAGVGVFAQAIVAADRVARERPDGPGGASPAERLRRDLRTYGDVLARHRPRRVRAVIDGEPLDEPLLALEAMNIPRLGPRLPLAPGADAGDGLLDVVAVPADGREALDELLGACAEGEPARGHPFPTRRARRIRLETAGDLLHADGRTAPAAGALELAVEAGALQVLAP